LRRRYGTGIEIGDGLALNWRRRQGVEIAKIRALADLQVTPEVRNSLAHTHPPPLVSTFLVGNDSKDSKLARIIDGGFHPQDAVLVVHLEPVVLDAVLDAPAFRTLFVIADELSAKLSRELAAEESHDVIRRKAGHGVVEQTRKDPLKAGPALPHQIGRHFAFIDNPVVATTGELLHHRKPWIDSARQSIEKPGPLAMAEPFAETLGELEVVDIKQGVFVTLVVDAALVELSGQGIERRRRCSGVRRIAVSGRVEVHGRRRPCD